VRRHYRAGGARSDLEACGAVDIPWDVALEVYAGHDLLRYTALCRAHLPGHDALSPHATARCSRWYLPRRLVRP
jgi:hypothetical protein